MPKEQCYIVPYWKNTDTPKKSKILMARKRLLQTRLDGSERYKSGDDAGNPVYIVPNYAGQWVLSGGARNWDRQKRDFSETAKQACLREFLEESGVDLRANAQTYGARIDALATKFADNIYTFNALYVSCTDEGLERLAHDANAALDEGTPADNEMREFEVVDLDEADSRLGPCEGRPSGTSWPEAMGMLLGFRPGPLSTKMNFYDLADRLAAQTQRTDNDWYKRIFATLRQRVGVT
jgi:ADP-ribose pyrophosphatase YjhB (NUDIX family)